MMMMNAMSMKQKRQQEKRQQWKEKCNTWLNGQVMKNKIINGFRKKKWDIAES